MAEACPLCGNEKRMRRPQELYGRQVCKKCRTSFANRRQLAYVADLLLLNGVQFVLAFLGAVALLLMGGAEDQIDIVTWAAVAVGLGLFLIKDGFTGCSPGKLLCGVRVLDVRTGLPIGAAQSAQRNLPLLIPFMPFVVAFGMMNGPRVGDRWAATRVIWKKYADHPVFAVGARPEAPREADSFAPMAVDIPDDGNPYRAPRSDAP